MKLVEVICIGRFKQFHSGSCFQYRKIRPLHNVLQASISRNESNKLVLFLM